MISLNVECVVGRRAYVHSTRELQHHFWATHRLDVLYHVALRSSHECSSLLLRHPSLLFVLGPFLLCRSLDRSGNCVLLEGPSECGRRQAILVLRRDGRTSLDLIKRIEQAGKHAVTATAAGMDAWTVSP